MPNRRHGKKDFLVHSVVFVGAHHNGKQQHKTIDCYQSILSRQVLASYGHHEGVQLYDYSFWRQQARREKMSTLLNVRQSKAKSNRTKILTRIACALSIDADQREYLQFQRTAPQKIGTSPKQAYLGLEWCSNESIFATMNSDQLQASPE